MGPPVEKENPVSETPEQDQIEGLDVIDLSEWPAEELGDQGEAEAHA